MARQLAFDLPVRAALGRDDFFVSPANALALAALEAPGGWPAGKLVLIGPEGAGKSHLARVWASAEAAEVIAAHDLAARPAPPQARAVVVEDADRIAGDLAAETALFHLHNLVLAEGGRLLITARSAPGRWPLVLPDLASRLLAAATARLGPPDDALLAAVLAKLFADRQIRVPAPLIPWLVARMDRSFAAADVLVAALDAAALAQNRPIGLALARSVLDRPDSDGP